MKNTYIEFINKICEGDQLLIESVTKMYKVLVEDTLQTSTDTTNTENKPDVVINTENITPDNAQVIAGKLVELAKTKEQASTDTQKIEEQQKEISNLAGASNG